MAKVNDRLFDLDKLILQQGLHRLPVRERSQMAGSAQPRPLVMRGPQLVAR
jgi:hypothetical protein